MSATTSSSGIAGIRLSACAAGLYRSGRPDMALFELSGQAQCAAVFTRSASAAAPVLVARRHLAAARSRFLLINAGNANAGTGDGGVEDARRLCQLVAEGGHCQVDQVLPFSTGVIGVPLAMEKMSPVITRLLHTLAPDQWLAVAQAIMTTDTRPKFLFRQFRIEDQMVSLAGVCKGSGMVRPDMATMLAFVASDVRASRGLAQSLLLEAVQDSFHCITIDGDTSTNDACVFIASGARDGLDLDQAGEPAVRRFAGQLQGLCSDLAQQIVRDGEGASKFVTIEVVGGCDQEQCRGIAFAIAHSPLCKVALFASDPNWGRFLAAAGQGGAYARPDLRRLDLVINGVRIMTAGALAPDYSEQAGQQAMQEGDIHILLDLHLGQARARIWTCDLGHEYVRINADYRS